MFFDPKLTASAVLIVCGLPGTAALAAPQTPATVSAVQPTVSAAPAKAKHVSLQTAVDGAKSLQVTVIQRAADKSGTLTDQARLTLTVLTSGAIRAERKGLTVSDPETGKKNPPALANPTLAVFNGTETFEYDADSRQYVRTAISADGSPIGHFVPLRQLWSAVRGVAEKEAQAAPDETLAGRRMRVRIVDFGTAGAAHPFIRLRYLIDAETNLLRQYEQIFWTGNTPRVTTQFEFSDWKINPTVSAAQFAWQPPATAKETSLYRPAPPAAEVPPALPIGSVAPDFTCLGEDGKTVKLSELRGKVVVIDFWATWCLPCIISMPHLQSVYETVKGNKDVVVLAVSVGDLRTAYDGWLKKKAYTFPTAYDLAGRDNTKNIAVTLYKAKSIPSQYIIDKDGKIAAVLVGYQGKADTRLEAALAKLGVSVPVKEASASR